MRRNPMRTVGGVLIVVGAVLILARGACYPTERASVRIGDVEVEAVARRFDPPIAGIVVLIAGIILVRRARKQS